MAQRANLSGTAITVTLVGAVLLYSAVKNKSISATVRSLLAGHPLPNDATASAVPSVGPGAGIITPSGPGLSTAGGSNYSYIDQTLQSLGFTKAGRAGALGNIQVETGGTFATTAYNPSEGAVGWCQWEGGRRTGLQAYARAHGWTETDPRAQAGWMRAELLSAYADVYLYMRTANDPGKAAAYWDAHYEKSSGAARAQRVADAQQIYGRLS